MKKTRSISILVANIFIEQGLDLDCDHRFLEGFCKSKDSNCQFEIATGS
jgi:hypothetical protein